jgi:hypothetical protein
MAGNSVGAIMGLQFPHLHAIALKRRGYPTSPGPTTQSQGLGKFPGGGEKPPEGGHAPRTFGLWHWGFGLGGQFGRLILWPRIPVSRKRRLRQAETGSTIVLPQK